jgi:hypothetical protein
MKLFCTLLSAILLSIVNNHIKAQPGCFSEDFTQPNSGWIFSNGAQLRSYNNPSNNCTADRGVVTPGAEINNPVIIKSPLITSNGNSIIRVTFDIYRMNLLLDCAGYGDFTCPTTLNATVNIGSTSIAGVSNLFMPKIGPGGTNTISFSMQVANNLPAGTNYTVSLTFNSRSGTPRCNQLTSNYVFDNFSVCQNAASEDVNAENDDYCSITTTGNTFSNNLSTNDQGSNLVYSLANGPYANNRTTTSGSLINIQPNGNFTFTRQNPSFSIFDFTYKITNTFTGKTDYATARICFTEGGPLPVSLLHFTTKRQKETAIIQWSTSFESNLSRFDIQRKGDNGFVTVGTVNPKNSESGSSYQFEEKNTNQAPTEYRLKIVEPGVADKYSKIQVLPELGIRPALRIFPNPTRGNANINIDNPSQQHKIDLLDVRGSLLQSINMKGNNRLTLPALQPGTYIIRLSGTTDQQISLQRLVVL